MSPISLKRRLQIHFVVIAEVIGYVLSLSIIGAAIALAFIDVDVSVKASGKLEPESNSVKLERAAVVLDLTKKSGEMVTAGENLAMLITDPNQFSSALAIREFRPIAARLRSQPAQSAQALLQAGETYQNEIERAWQPQAILAPAAGLWVTTHPLALQIPMLAGQSIGHVYNLQQPAMTLKIDKKDAEKIKPGQAVQVILPADVVLRGAVAGKSDSAGTAWRVRFAPAPAALQEHWREQLLASPALPVPDAQASIIVGKQSLFSKLILRK